MAATAAEVHELKKRLQYLETRCREQSEEALRKKWASKLAEKNFSVVSICRLCGTTWTNHILWTHPGDLCPGSDCRGKVDVVISYKD